MAVTALERRPATWAEYQALGEDVRAEYIDGCIVMMNLPSISHQRAAHRLANALEAVLPPGYAVVMAAAWKPADDEFGPDVMVYPTAEVTSDLRFTGTPVLCVEILSSNRSNDTLVKTVKYAEAGLNHYWILDPRDGLMDVLVREGQHYQLVGEVTMDEATDVSFGIASATIDLSALLDG